MLNKLDKQGYNGRNYIKLYKNRSYGNQTNYIDEKLKELEYSNEGPILKTKHK